MLLALLRLLPVSNFPVSTIFRRRTLPMIFSSASLFSTSSESAANTYQPLPAPDEETLLESGDKHTPDTGPPTRSLDPSFWVTILAILSIAVTIRNLFVLQLSTQGLTSSYLEVSFARPYNGLEKVPRNESSPSWPLSSIHYPDFIGSTEGALVHHSLDNGSVVRLDPERRVILQHRVRDYGLERCAIQVEFSHSSGKQHGHTPRGYGYIGESPYLTLWRVLDDAESRAVLVPSALPKSLPSRREFLGNITLDKTHHTRSPFFACTAGTVQTLEVALACASEQCVMEFRLVRSPNRQGFLVVQSE